MSASTGPRTRTASGPGRGRPSISERLSAALALTALAAAGALLVFQIVVRLGAVLLALAGLLGCVTASWYLVSRRGAARAGATVVALVALAVLVAGLVSAVVAWWLPVAVIGLAVISAGTARHALRRTPKAIRSRQHGAAASARTSSVRPAGAGTEPVLIVNLKSGDGKAERAGLPDECRARGIEPVILRPGDDLVALAEAAAARSVPAIGMAGGDGSQAAVADVAARNKIPFVCVPAGTRNHFALDLGLDRADVVGALDAYVDRAERVIDLATVNGRAFVNNCSLGLYAKIVQSPQYRDAKVRTAAGLLPDLIGPEAEPLDLRFAGPAEGETFRTAHLILVSNNRYQLAHPGGRGTRERLDTGLLGVVVAQVADAADARRFMLLEITGQVARFHGWREWTADRFEVYSAGPVEVGVDGEALVLGPPLVFRAWPGALRVWLPSSALRLSPAARTVRLLTRSTAADLVSVAAGTARPISLTSR